MNKRLWIVLGVLVVATFGGLMWYRNVTEDNDPVAYANELDGTKLITKEDIIAAQEKTLGRSLTDEEKDNIIEDHYDGRTDAEVVVVEWEDFACSHCQAFQTYAEQIKEDYKDRVLFIVRDFSLNYPNSIATLSAGNAVAKLGGNEAFWKMSEQLFKDEKWISSAVQSGERKELFEEYAKTAGVDVDEFNQLLTNTENNGIQDKIDRDKRLGENLGVTGTPTWMVNGKKVESTTEEDIRAAIEAALNGTEPAESESGGEKATEAEVVVNE